MARYFMHLIDDDEVLLDKEGRYHQTLGSLRNAALLSAREVIAGDVHEGIINLNQRIHVHDEKDNVVHRLEFETAVVVTRGPPG